jgi:quercetin dioxygenase-like cupin family protein
MELRTLGNTPEDLAMVQRPDMRGMHVWWLVSKETAGSEKILFDSVIFPSRIVHALHRHPNAEEICYLVSGNGYHLHEGEPVLQRTGEAVYIPANEWHGFYNPYEEPVTMVSCWGGVASIEQAGYEEMEDSLAIVRAQIERLAIS